MHNIKKIYTDMSILKLFWNVFLKLLSLLIYFYNLFYNFKNTDKCLQSVCYSGDQNQTTLVDTKVSLSQLLIIPAQLFDLITIIFRLPWQKCSLNSLHFANWKGNVSTFWSLTNASAENTLIYCYLWPFN